MTALDIRCDVVVGIGGAWLDGGLDDRDREPFEIHLLVCTPCRGQLDKLRTLRAALAATAPPTPLGLPGRPLPARLRDVLRGSAAVPGATDPQS
jgi:hypothetical protein